MQIQPVWAILATRPLFTGTRPRLFTNPEPGLALTPLKKWHFRPLNTSLLYTFLAKKWPPFFLVTLFTHVYKYVHKCNPSLAGYFILFEHLLGQALRWIRYIWSLTLSMRKSCAADDSPNSTNFFQKMLNFKFFFPYLNSTWKMHLNEYKQA